MIEQTSNKARDYDIYGAGTLCCCCCMGVKVKDKVKLVSKYKIILYINGNFIILGNFFIFLGYAISAIYHNCHYLIFHPYYTHLQYS